MSIAIVWQSVFIFAGKSLLENASPLILGTWVIVFVVIMPTMVLCWLASYFDY